MPQNRCLELLQGADLYIDYIKRTGGRGRDRSPAGGPDDRLQRWRKTVEVPTPVYRGGSRDALLLCAGHARTTGDPCRFWRSTRWALIAPSDRREFSRPR